MKNNKMKNIFPNVVIILLYFLFTGCQSNNYKPEIHYIPNGFIGEIQIFMNQKNGHEMEYDSAGYRVYRIPNNGILYTKFDINTGWISDSNTVKYYYTDSLTNKITKLKYCSICYNNELQNKNEIGVLGGVYKNKSNENFSATILTYYVDTIKNYTKY